MVHGLLFGQAGNWRQYSEGITAEQNQVLGMWSSAGDAGIVNECDGVGGARVFCDSAAYTQNRSQSYQHRQVSSNCMILTVNQPSSYARYNDLNPIPLVFRCNVHPSVLSQNNGSMHAVLGFWKSK